MLGVPVWTAWRFGGGDSGGGPRICNGPIVEAMQRRFRPILTLDTAREVEKRECTAESVTAGTPPASRSFIMQIKKAVKTL
jgi:hypothetical protein